MALARDKNETETDATAATDPSERAEETSATGPDDTLPGPPVEDAVVVSGTDDGAHPMDGAPRDAPDDDSVMVVDPDGNVARDDDGDIPRDPGEDVVGRVGPAEMPVEDQAAAMDEVRVDGSETSRVPAPVQSAPAGSGSMGFVILLLGGLIAGGIGYALATFGAPPPTVEDTARLDAIEARLDEIGAGVPDLAPVEEAQADLSARLDAVGARLDEVEGREPAPDAATQAAGATIAAAPEDGEVADLRADLDALRERVDGLSVPEGLDGLDGRVGALEDDLAPRIAALEDDLAPRVTTLEEELPARLDALAAEIEGVSAENVAVEDEAERAVREAARNQLVLAMESGLPYDEPLAQLGGDVPDPLAAPAEAGIPTVAELTAAFPEPSRRALAVARASEPVDGNPVTAFLRRQTGARSLEPRDGDDADAVLSRAEAAIRAGDVATALTEVEALPDDARAELSDWIARAETRRAAQAALQDYLNAE